MTRTAQGNVWIAVALTAMSFAVTACDHSGAAERAQPKRAARVLPPPPQQPNVLLIVADTLRFDATSLGGQPESATPQLAQLAKNGISFVNSYSTWDETTGSHFSLLTGYTTGVSTPLNDPAHSLAQQFEAAGYRTFGTSANLQLSQKSFRPVMPFDDYVSLGDEWTSKTPAQKRAAAPPLDARIKLYGGRFTDFNRLMMYVTGDRVMESVRAQIARAQPPFFGFVNLMYAHDPYFPDPRVYDLASEPPAPRWFDGDVRNRPAGRELSRPEMIRDAKQRELVTKTLAGVSGRAWSTTFNLSPEALALYRRRYQGAVRHTDQSVGEIIELLRERGLLDSTIVVITSDHGESFGEQHLITHAFGNRGDRESTHRVPLLFVVPRSYQFPVGARESTVALSDVAPTLYDLAGIDWTPMERRTPVPGTYGRSLLAHLRTPVSVQRRPTSGAPPMKTDDQREREEAERRMRSLGYLQ